ncbi:hypothetical protein B296_00027993 [Ensete ventricosum]|uniref:Uncharacterized protein n=1 Tax=Ensete ventricosum TaxID=4639 RepID=A0A426YQZ4_ENSVE|nr:hypothetical protein B296_00027993 [Ensete ventricosum]
MDVDGDGVPITRMKRSTWRRIEEVQLTRLRLSLLAATPSSSHTVTVAASDAATVSDRGFPRYSASHRGLLGCSELPWFARLIVHGKEKTRGDVCVRGSWKREQEEWRACVGI